MDETKQLSWLYDLYRMEQSEAARENPSIVQQHILQHIVSAFEAGAGSLALCEDGGRDLRIVAAIGLPDGVIYSVIPRGEYVLGYVAEQGEPLLLNGDIRNDTRFHHVRQHMKAMRYFSAMCWPLMLEECVIGALAINRAAGQPPFTDDDLKQGAVLVGLISVIAENARFHSGQLRNAKLYQEANRQLEEAHNQEVRSREYLDQILNALDNVVWSIAPETFETLYLNPAAEKVYGRPVADFMADSNLWFETVHPDDRNYVGDCLPEIMEKGVMDIEYRIVRPDGEVHTIHDHIHIIYDEHGKAVSLNGLGTDITMTRQAEINLKKSHAELQEAYSKLQEMQGQLLQSEKLASIGQLAAGVAHEINNPIGYVYSNLGSLQKYLNEIFSVVEAYENITPLLAQHPDAVAGIQSVKQKVDLEFLKKDVTDLMSESREGITRVKKIVQDLKDFSHVGSEEEWQLADLRQGIDSTLNIVNNEIKYKAEVQKEYGDIPDIECLPPQINQVFMNLLVNAAHAIEEKGIITVRTGTLDDHVWMEVADTGKGISAEHLSRIFDPFFTTKPVGTGTGLGLSVSYSIIQKHHGSIDVASEVGKGTTFRILLPIKQPEEQIS